MKEIQKVTEDGLYYGPDRSRLEQFAAEIIDPKSHLGEIISIERIRKSGQHIQEAIAASIVNNGHGAKVR